MSIVAAQTPTRLNWDSVVEISKTRRLTCCWALPLLPPTSQSDRWCQWERAGCLSHSGRTPVFKQKSRSVQTEAPGPGPTLVWFYHLRSWTSRTGRPTPSCWTSSPGCPSRNASGKPDGADELQEDTREWNTRLFWSCLWLCNWVLSRW